MTVAVGASILWLSESSNAQFIYSLVARVDHVRYCSHKTCVLALYQDHNDVKLVLAHILLSYLIVALCNGHLSCKYARGCDIKHPASDASAKSAAGLYRQDNTFCAFHQINHPILGLSSRSVSLVRYSLTFRTSKDQAVLDVSEVSHAFIPVHEVEEVKA